MPLEWDLHYAEWIIADGEPDLAVEDDFDWFSIEFWSTSKLRKTPEPAKSAVAISDYRYQVIAEVVFLSEKAYVIDFGLRAIGRADEISAECKQGDYVTGEITLVLPLCTEIVPEEVSNSLQGRWHVNGIHADTTPYISYPDKPNFFFRDESRIRYEPVQSTATITAHTYVLHCTKHS